MKKEAIYLLLLLQTVLSSSSKAESIVPFWKENFNAIFPPAWSTGDATGQNVDWQRCSNPYTCPPASSSFSCSDPYFRSETFEDGYMYVDSYGAGLLSVPAQSYLRTPFIDCTGKSSVFIQFYTYIYAVNNAPDANAILRVRSGNGPWTEFVVFPHMNLQESESIQGFNAHTVQLDISSVAANKSNVTVEWRWTHKFDNAWMIDDVKFFDKNPLHENVIWGHQPGQGDFAGGMNGWSASNALDTCKWTWVNTTKINLVDKPTNIDLRADALACWSGAENGAMLMNSSFCWLGGLPSSYSLSDLESPTIDLSDSTTSGDQLFLIFNQVIAVANKSVSALPETSIAISINDGSTFIDTIDVNPVLPYLNAVCEEKRILLPASVAGKPGVRLRFIFAADINFWMIDNIRIAKGYDIDLELNPEFYNVAPDFSVPKDQIKPILLSAQIRNTGNSVVGECEAKVQVLNASNTLVFQDSIVFEELAPGETWTNVFFPNKFTPSAIPDEYRIFYSIASLEEEEYMSNNKVNWSYKITEGTFSKNEYCNLSSFHPIDEYGYEIGNCYLVPNGSQAKAKSISFGFKNAEKLAAGNAKLIPNLYRWKKGSLVYDSNLDSLANSNEYELIAAGEYLVEGNEDNNVVTVLLEPFSDDDDSIYLENGTYYFATVSYLNVAYDANQNPVLFPIVASEAINYTSMFFNSYEDGGPAYVSMLREAGEDKFRANPWALRRIPFVNLNIEYGVNTTRPERPQNGKIRLEPNPANEIVRLTTDFPTSVRQIRVEIFDICGRLSSSTEIDNGNVSQLSIPIHDLRNGSYILRVVAGENIYSEKLLIVR